MTIILPEGKWAQRKWKIKYKSHRLYRKVRTAIDWKWGQIHYGSVAGVEREDLRRVRVTHPTTGKKSWMVIGRVEFRPFRINSTKTLNPDDLIYLRINHVEGQTE